MEGVTQEEATESVKQKPVKAATSEPRKRRSRVSSQVNVYAKNTTKNNRSYADMDDEYSYLDADREEWLCPKRVPRKHKAEIKETIGNTIQIKPVVSIPKPNHNSVNSTGNVINRSIFV